MEQEKVPRLILGLKSPDEGNTTILGMNAAKHRKKVFEKVGVNQLFQQIEIII